MPNSSKSFPPFSSYSSMTEPNPILTPAAITYPTTIKHQHYRAVKPLWQQLVLGMGLVFKLDLSQLLYFL